MQPVPGGSGTGARAATDGFGAAPARDEAAGEGARVAPEARVRFEGSKARAGAGGGHVEAAARAARAGWAMPRILEMLRKITLATDTVFTLAELKYLIHGGRISHMKGLPGRSGTRR